MATTCVYSEIGRTTQIISDISVTAGLPRLHFCRRRDRSLFAGKLYRTETLPVKKVTCPSFAKKRPSELVILKAHTFMPKAGFEPARLAAPPPQDGVSANSTTSARLIFYRLLLFRRGWRRCRSRSALLRCRLRRSLLAGCCCCCCCFCFAPSRITDEPPGCEIKIVSASDVIMKMTAATVVALLRTVPACRAPKVDWLPPPPKAPARSAPLPCCSRTTRIKKTQTMT